MFGFEVKKTLEKQLKASKGFSHKFSGDNFPTIFQTPVPVMVESESAGTSSFPGVGIDLVLVAGNNDGVWAFFASPPSPVLPRREQLSRR